MSEMCHKDILLMSFLSLLDRLISFVKREICSQIVRIFSGNPDVSDIEKSNRGSCMLLWEGIIDSPNICFGQKSSDSQQGLVLFQSTQIEKSWPDKPLSIAVDLQNSIIFIYCMLCGYRLNFSVLWGSFKTVISAAWA